MPNSECDIKRIMIEVAYDGTNYHGWQYQPGASTIEGELNKALSELCKEEIVVIGASRTDAGVHAYDNVAVFDTISRIPAEKFPYALNERLPEDIRVWQGRLVGKDFHPRHCDTMKTYEYHIWNAQFENPIVSRYMHHVYFDLDIAKMQKACEFLVGEHDFTSFCSVNAQSETRVRTIYSLCVEKNGYELVVRVKGNGFLYNMVRIIAGTLIEVGRGKLEPDLVGSILEAKDRNAAGPTAPAKGLTLVKYEFVTNSSELPLL